MKFFPLIRIVIRAAAAVVVVVVVVVVAVVAVFLLSLFRYRCCVSLRASAALRQVKGVALM